MCASLGKLTSFKMQVTVTQMLSCEETFEYKLEVVTNYK